MRPIDCSQRTFVSYIDKSREYYLAQGDDNPYRWAHFDDVPFTPLAKPLSECCVALITTAAHAGPTQAQLNALRWKRVYRAPAEPAPDSLYTDDLSWDKDATHTRDLGSYLPLQHLQEFAARGRIGRAGANFYGLPTEYSQRQTLDQDAPEIAQLCRADGIDAAMFVPL